MEQFCSSLLCLYSSLELKRMITSVILYNSCFYKYDQILPKPLKEIHSYLCSSTDSKRRKTILSKLDMDEKQIFRKRPSEW